ncbi:MAG: hypothetical protein CK522_03020 [Opitutia bacterium]|nr:MAG: hypothetical protein CK522_03020 [Opitutae bacterium]
MKPFALLLLFLVLPTWSRAERPYFGAEPSALEKAKQAIAAGDPVLVGALKKLKQDAEKALLVAPASVTEKQKLPPSGDAHDYMSLAPYFWPDSAKPKGLPYLRKDGEVNPESRELAANDTLRVRALAATVEALALAYYFTAEEKYAAHAAQHMRVWFLAPATRMNPNLKFAQAVLGLNDGRGTGIIEARGLAVAADAAILLLGSKAWTKDDQTAVERWGDQYYEWLLRSKNGQDERAAKNNHGTWYDVQAVHWALVLKRTEEAKGFLDQAGVKRIEVQIEPDGRQPLELSRTASFSYSCFNLRALSDLALLGQHAGVNLWAYRSKDGRSLRVALDYLVPYLGKQPKPWPGQQIHGSNPDEIMPVLRRAAHATGATAYEELLAQYAEAPSKRLQLVAPR